MAKEYKFSAKNVKVKKRDTDITMTLPNGMEITFQFRRESDTMDVLFPVSVIAHSWMGSDMKPGKRVKKFPPHVRRVDQICVELPPRIM